MTYKSLFSYKDILPPKVLPYYQLPIDASASSIHHFQVSMS